MPKAFSEIERATIRQRLLEIGEDYWGRYGVRKSSVDGLARTAGVSKGTFYLFFETKELFFMAVLERCHQRIESTMLQALHSAAGSPRERFVQVIWGLHGELSQYPWLVSLLSGDGDYEYLLRKLPEERVLRHILADDQNAASLLQLFDLEQSVSAAELSAALRGLFLLLLHRKEIGLGQADRAWKLLLEGLALRLFGGAK